MSESFRHETPQFEGLDIERITRRIADTTGKTEFDPTQRHLTDSVLTFDTQHGGGLGQAALLLIPGRAIDRNTNTYNVVEAVRVPIGHYDPADKEWQLYGELIAEGEKESVSVTLDNLSFSLKPIYEERARVGLPYVDLFHPVTHLARKEMSDRLKDHELASSIFDRNKVAALQQGSQVQDAVIDPSTSCHFVVQTLPFRRTLITSEGADQLVERVDGLYIAYDGLRLNDNNMHIQRTLLKLLVAHTSPDNPADWVPYDNIEAHEWAAISDIPARLRDYKTINDQFMTETCAVSANWPTDV